MAGQAAAMHVARIRSGYTDKEGQRREYESRYLRRTYRDGGKVRHETLANLSGLPEAVTDSIEAALKGTALVPADRAVTILRSLPHVHVAAGGYSRDGKKGKLQIEYGLLTDPSGRPVAVRVFPGNTGDPGAFTAIVDVVRKSSGWPR